MVTACYIAQKREKDNCKIENANKKCQAFRFFDTAAKNKQPPEWMAVFAFCMREHNGLKQKK